MLGSGDYHGCKHSFLAGGLRVYEALNIIKRAAVMGNSWSAGHNLGVFSNEKFCPYTLLSFKQVRISVKVVEIFQQRKVQRLFNVAVPLFFGEFCRQVNSKLLIGNSVFKGGFVARFQQ